MSLANSSILILKKAVKLIFLIFVDLCALTWAYEYDLVRNSAGVAPDATIAVYSFSVRLLGLRGRTFDFILNAFFCNSLTNN